MTDATEVHVPEACELPLGERPLRQAEFDALFAHGLTAQERVSPTVLRWTLDSGVDLVARDLTDRETACCSFFTFDFSVDGDSVRVELIVPPSHIKVLDVLASRASISLASA